jgi:hypothetical protein
MNRNQQAAIKAINLRFPRITDLAFLDIEEEAAIMNLIDDALSTLVVRSRSQKVQNQSTEMLRMMKEWSNG